MWLCRHVCRKISKNVNWGMSDTAKRVQMGSEEECQESKNEKFCENWRKFCSRRWGSLLSGMRTLDPPLGSPSTWANFSRTKNLLPRNSPQIFISNLIFLWIKRQAEFKTHSGRKVTRIESRWKFPLAPIGSSLRSLSALDPSLRPHQHQWKFFRTHVCLKNSLIDNLIFFIVITPCKISS